MVAYNWIEIVNKIISKNGKENPLNFKDELYEFIFFGYPDNKMGFLVVWNQLSRRAINVSRMEIPESIEFKLITDESSSYDDLIPNDLIFESDISDE